MNLWNRRKAAVIFVLMVLIVGTTLYWEETPRQNKAPLDPEAVMTKQRGRRRFPVFVSMSAVPSCTQVFMTLHRACAMPMPSARQAA